MSVSLFICLFVYICLCVYMSICVYVSLFMCLSVSPFLCLSFSFLLHPFSPPSAGLGLPAFALADNLATPPTIQIELYTMIWIRKRPYEHDLSQRFPIIINNNRRTSIQSNNSTTLSNTSLDSRTT